MTNIPQIGKTGLPDIARELITASEAVREGIATHAEKHVARIHNERARLEETRKLQRSTKAIQ